MSQRLGDKPAAAAQFALAARVARQNEAVVVRPSHVVKMDGEKTLPRLCAGCGQMLPHKRGHKVCILCEMEGES
jgi:hypothetical protein